MRCYIIHRPSARGQEFYAGSHSTIARGEEIRWSGTHPLLIKLSLIKSTVRDLEQRGEDKLTTSAVDI